MKNLETKKKHAFVTFVMRNDSFIPGALCFAYALHQQNTTKDLISIVSPEVSAEGIRALKTVYDDVIVLEEIYVPHKNRQDRQDRPFLFTRFHALRLGSDGNLGKTYDKIVIADADLLPLKYYDQLFEIEAPAGVINEKKTYCMEYENGRYIVPDSVNKDGTWRWHRQYQDIPFGAPIPKNITDRVLNDNENMGMNAALYLFKPSMELFNDILHDLEDEQVRKRISEYPWPEMQYITAKLSGQWHNLDLKYSSFNGYPVIDVLYGIHYAGLKPWQHRHRSIKHFAKNEDYCLWYATFMEMMNAHPSLHEYSKTKKLTTFIHELQANEAYRFKRKNLGNVKHLFQR